MQYQSRYGGSQRKQTRGGGRAVVVLLLLACAAVVAIISSSKAADYVSERIIAPIISYFSEKFENDAINENVNEGLQNGDEAVEGLSPSSNEDQLVTTNMQFAAMTFYMLQLDYFSDEASASIAAEQYRGIGAAGYVIKDESFRVIGAAYTDEASLYKVQQQLREDGYKNSAYIVHTDELQVSLSAEKSIAETAENGFAYVFSLPSQLTDFSLSFDRGEIGADDVNESFALSVDNIQYIIETIKTSDAQGSLTELCSTLEVLHKFLSTFLENNANMNWSSTEYAMQLKYTQIAAIDSCIQFVKALGVIPNEGS